jgi:hypothetical protein
MKFYKNTDTVDIAAKSLGISNDQGLDNRGLHIQIKHNGKHGDIAERISTVIVNALNEADLLLDKTIVVFRKFKKEGDIIALFPHEDFSPSGLECMSYQHMGQHSSADYDFCMRLSVPATEEEYKPLLNELLRIGYDLKIQKRK